MRKQQKTTIIEKSPTGALNQEEWSADEANKQANSKQIGR